MERKYNPNSNSIPKSLKEATRFFLEGTDAKSPEQAILSGQRTIYQWSAVLDELHKGVFDEVSKLR